MFAELIGLFYGREGGGRNVTATISNAYGRPRPSHSGTRNPYEPFKGAVTTGHATESTLKASRALFRCVCDRYLLVAHELRGPKVESELMEWRCSRHRPFPLINWECFCFISVHHR